MAAVQTLLAAQTASVEQTDTQEAHFALMETYIKITKHTLAIIREQQTHIVQTIQHLN